MLCIKLWGLKIETSAKSALNSILSNGNSLGYEKGMSE